MQTSAHKMATLMVMFLQLLNVKQDEKASEKLLYFFLNIFYSIAMDPAYDSVQLGSPLIV